MPSWLDKLKSSAASTAHDLTERVGSTALGGAALQGLSNASDLADYAKYLIAPDKLQRMGDREQQPGAYTPEPENVWRPMGKVAPEMTPRALVEKGLSLLPAPVAQGLDMASKGTPIAQQVRDVLEHGAPSGAMLGAVAGAPAGGPLGSGAGAALGGKWGNAAKQWFDTGEIDWNDANAEGTWQGATELASAGAGQGMNTIMRGAAAPVSHISQIGKGMDREARVALREAANEANLTTAKQLVTEGHWTPQTYDAYVEQMAEYPRITAHSSPTRGGPLTGFADPSAARSGMQTQGGFYYGPKESKVGAFSVASDLTDPAAARAAIREETGYHTADALSGLDRGRNWGQDYTDELRAATAEVGPNAAYRTHSKEVPAKTWVDQKADTDALREFETFAGAEPSRATRRGTGYEKRLQQYRAFEPAPRPDLGGTEWRPR